MNKYIFYGRVVPEIHDINESGFIELSLKNELEKDTSISFNITNSNIIASVVSQETNLLDIRNTLYGNIDSYVSIVSFLKGVVLDVYIDKFDTFIDTIDIYINRFSTYLGQRKVTEPSITGEYIVFGAQCISERNKGILYDQELVSKTAYDYFVKICNLKNSQIVFKAFQSLRDAMKNPFDTGFHCYRAVESLRSHYAVNEGLASEKNDSQIWKCFRSLLDIQDSNNTILDTIKPHADPSRHGGIKSITDEERVKILLCTWDIVENYLKKAFKEEENNNVKR